MGQESLLLHICPDLCKLFSCCRRFNGVNEGLVGYCKLAVDKATTTLPADIFGHSALLTFGDFNQTRKGEGFNVVHLLNGYELPLHLHGDSRSCATSTKEVHNKITFMGCNIRVFLITRSSFGVLKSSLVAIP